MPTFWTTEVPASKLMIYSATKYAAMIRTIDEGSKESSRARYVLFFWRRRAGKRSVPQ